MADLHFLRCVALASCTQPVTAATPRSSAPSLVPQVRKLTHPKRVWQQIMAIMERLAQCGLVHCDFNEFNLLIDEEEKVTLIDFPQMVSISHPNAELFFDRDVDCLKRFFVRKYDFRAADHAELCELDFKALKAAGAGDGEAAGKLDKELRASGFGAKEQAELETVLEEERAALLEEDEGAREARERRAEEGASGSGGESDSEDEGSEEEGDEAEEGSEDGEEGRESEFAQASRGKADEEEEEEADEAEELRRAEHRADAAAAAFNARRGVGASAPSSDETAAAAAAAAAARQAVPAVAGDDATAAEATEAGAGAGEEEDEDTASVAGLTITSTMDPRERAIRERLKAERRRVRRFCRQRCSALQRDDAHQPLPTAAAQVAKQCADSLAVSDFPISTICAQQLQSAGVGEAAGAPPAAAEPHEGPRRVKAGAWGSGGCEQGCRRRSLGLEDARSSRRVILWRSLCHCSRPSSRPNHRGRRAQSSVWLRYFASNKKAPAARAGDVKLRVVPSACGPLLLLKWWQRMMLLERVVRSSSGGGGGAQRGSCRCWRGCPPPFSITLPLVVKRRPRAPPPAPAAASRGDQQHAAASAPASYLLLLLRRRRRHHRRHRCAVVVAGMYEYQPTNHTTTMDDDFFSFGAAQQVFFCSSGGPLLLMALLPSSYLPAGGREM